MTFKLYIKGDFKVRRFKIGVKTIMKNMKKIVSEESYLKKNNQNWNLMSMLKTAENKPVKITCSPAKRNEELENRAKKPLRNMEARIRRYNTHLIRFQ